MQLFYHPKEINLQDEITFDKEESRHIQKVLRKKEGDQLYISDGLGSFFTAELTTASGKVCMARILKEEKTAPLPYTLHLAVAPTKLNDRYEWFLEKATEIGISEITPLLCEHSERKVIKKERYEKIIQSAMKQSLKAYLPRLYDLNTFKDFIIKNSNFQGIKAIAHCENQESKISLKSVLKPSVPVLLLIGPEGDFSSEEITLALDCGFTPVSLGDSRLRTETAAIVACHSVAFVNER